jgi:glutaredoxin
MEAAMKLFPLLLACAVLLAPAHAQVYKWTDPSGKTHYGDRPPDDVRKQEVAIRIDSYDGPVEVVDWAAVLRRRSPGTAAPRAPSAITMYSTAWCPHCRNARAYFAARSIAFTEIDVEKSEAGRREYEALGGKGVPYILVGDKAMRGFSAKRFEALRR